ncbi:heme A synthase [Pseudoruegeria sp. SHC-113]|uniref:heme A synthase n=1 Tax=Pseudoruegeria sp. SHC-113 TaxID=2855439 RepID=UPI0021BAB028|nr:heme A synthase [Pseudoruegeria sp. SHC-113]MCT8160392.1 COX15/CtaA family protein [Pseudoruegeria sp. SHC-113]
MSQKRAIFEEVGTAEKAQVAAPNPGLIDKASAGGRRAIRIWLMMLFALVAAMILVGGLTRLTDSGLSITEWNLVTGAVPPLNEADWQAEFDKYREIPQYELMNKGMTLAEFQFIYWWEWGHRQLGRFVGLVWGVGFLFFLATKRIPTGWAPRLLGLGALGGLQGAIGWWMVSSGLTGRMVSVASYRLAIHLGLAFIILGLITWFILKLGRSEAALMQARRARNPKLFSMGTGLMHFAFLQILIGALVAGIDAGRGYIDWPLMAGQWIPDDMFNYTPFWSNFFENPALVQFIHRMAAYLLFIFGIVTWRHARASGNDATKRAFDWMAVMLFGQVVLGIVTVMHASPWNIAILHQLGGIALWVLIIRARFYAQYPITQTIRSTKA